MTAKKILILDDDPSFNSLLTNIFSKSKHKYELTSCLNPTQALKLLEEQSFDLLISDYKMPELSGLEFLKRVKKKFPLVPIYMVSAFLDNSTLRELINSGIDQIFLKPLNVFSLLERVETSLEIKKTPTKDNYSSGATETNEDQDTELPFNFRTFPGTSPRGRKLGLDIYGKYNFKTNLILVGQEGNPFTPLIKDIETLSESTFIHISDNDLNWDQVSILVKSASDSPQPTLVTPLIASLTPDQQECLLNLLNKRDELKPDLRLILCLAHPPDTLLDSGVINDELYLLIGNNEIDIPRLSELKSELPELAERLIDQYSESFSLSPTPLLSNCTKNFIQEYDWPGDYQQLATLFTSILKNSPPAILDADFFRDSLGRLTAPEDWIKEKLSHARDEYTQTINLLSYLDTTAAEAILHPSDSPAPASIPR